MIKIGIDVSNWMNTLKDFSQCSLLNIFYSIFSSITHFFSYIVLVFATLKMITLSRNAVRNYLRYSLNQKGYGRYTFMAKNQIHLKQILKKRKSFQQSGTKKSKDF